MQTHTNLVTIGKKQYFPPLNITTLIQPLKSFQK